MQKTPIFITANAIVKNVGNIIRREQNGMVPADLWHSNADRARGQPLRDGEHQGNRFVWWRQHDRPQCRSETSDLTQRSS